MVGLLPPPHPSLLSSLNSKTIRLSSSPRPLTPSIHHISCRWNPRLSRLRPPAAGKARRIRIDRSQRGGDDDEEPSPRPVEITDEWGEKDEPEVDSTTEADLPKDYDEWGREESSTLSASAGALAVITDEWGEKTVPEQEEPATPDPPLDEDEWGNGSPAPEDKLGNLKRCLVDTFYGTELGLRANADVRSEILELVSQLEAENPTQAPNEALQFLDGNWILLYTAFSELIPLLALSSTPLLKIKKISQSIDSKNRTIVNETTLSSPGATFSFTASASFEVQTPSRIKVEFKEGAVRPPEVSPTLNLPETLEIFGQKVDLQLIKRSLDPLQQAFANISGSVSRQPPFKFPFPGNGARSWLLTTYLDEDFRISRGDGGLFVLAKEGSPLLDLLL